jgi:hypothetical protein
MIKWIGQHIWDFISRFRNDVYLESVADGTVHEDKFLGLDSTGKIVKETVSTGAASTVTVTDSTANTDFPIVFNDEATAASLLDDTGAFEYNPSLGSLIVPSIKHSAGGASAGDYGPGAEILYGVGSTSVSAGVIYGLRSGTWVAMDADFESYTAPLCAVATAAAGSGDSSNGMLIKGCVTLASVYTAGTDQLGLPVYASLAAGGEATLSAPTAAGDFVRILGYSLNVSDKKMFFNPDNTYIELA